MGFHLSQTDSCICRLCDVLSMARKLLIAHKWDKKCDQKRPSVCHLYTSGMLSILIFPHKFRRRLSKKNNINNNDTGGYWLVVVVAWGVETILFPSFQIGCWLSMLKACRRVV